MSASARWVLWVVGILALLWHAGSVVSLLVQMNPEMMEEMPESHQAVAKARPMWATIAYSLSAIAGVLGSFALLFRHRICGPLFFLSFICSFCVMLQAVLTGGAMSELGGIEIELVVALAAPVVIGVFLVVFAHRARKGGWLRGKPVE